VLSNWETEFARFAPQVKVLRYHGSTAERGAIRDDHQYVHPPSL
jgi:SNF2 family DNA or RNA helicase